MAGDGSGGSAVTSYAAVLERVTALVEGLTPGQLAQRVPCCPGWSVQQLLAHLSGAARDIASGNVENAGSDAWTSRQVADRRGRDGAELVAEWHEFAPRMAFALESPAGAQIVMDALTHELDLRTALGRPSRPADADLRHALGFTTRQFGKHVQRTMGLPPIAVRTELGDWPIGLGEPGIELSCSAVDLLRSVTGRRSWDQVAALDWSAPPDAYRTAFTWAAFEVPSAPTEEPASAG